MRPIRKAAGMMFALCMAASFGAAADDAPGRDMTDIREQQVELRAAAAAGNGMFDDMSNPERLELVARQDELLALIDGKQTVKDLDDADQVRAFNLLEAISATITHVEGQQMVCEMTRKTGSHRKSKVCMTRAQRDQLREDSKYVMEKAYNGLCFKGGSACGFGSDN